MDSEHEERLKTSVHFTVGKVCEEQDGKYKVKFPKEVISIINEILWGQIRQTAQDLEAFAKHGKRTTINVDDVKLLVRRNEDLKAKVENMGSANNLEDTVRLDKGKALKKRKSEPPPVAEVQINSDDDMFV